MPTSGPFDDTVTVTVPDGCMVVDVNVDLEIQHTWISDINLNLDGPEATGGLFSGICGSGDDWGPSTLDDSSGNPVTAACNGTAIPDVQTGSGTGLDGNFPGTNPTGDWTLTGVDNFGGDSGQVVGWGLTIVTERP